MTDATSEVEPEKESRPIIIRNTTDLQRLKLEKLMKNPEKPVIIPEKPKERGVPVVPDFVRNVMGSSAGAGSGEFHVYRHLRRKEYARQKYMKEKGERERLDNEYHEKLKENQHKAEKRTAKKRRKRLKKKQKQKIRSKKSKTTNQSESESCEFSGSELESEGHNDENPAEDKSENNSGSTGECTDVTESVGQSNENKYIEEKPQNNISSTCYEKDANEQNGEKSYENEKIESRDENDLQRTPE